METVYHAMMTRITGWTGCYSVISTCRLINYIEKFKPDIVHIHELHAYFVNIKPLLSYLAKKQIPVIWTFHCEFMYTGKCGHALSCNNWQSGCGNCPHLKSYPTVLFFDRTKEMLAEKKKLVGELQKLIITVPSPWLYDRVKSSYLSSRDVRIVYNGIDTKETFQLFNKPEVKACLFPGSGKQVILSVAQNIVKRAGACICEIAKKLPQMDFYLIGDAQKPDRYPDNIHLIGRVSDQKLLAQYYSAADFFLLCSKKETFSMPCAEALCCGTQVVGYKAGAPESIFEKPYAEFVEYGDVDAIVRLITEKAMCPISPNACASYGKSNFSEEAMCMVYIKMYDEVCGK